MQSWNFTEFKYAHDSVTLTFDGTHLRHSGESDWCRRVEPGMMLHYKDNDDGGYYLDIEAGEGGGRRVFGDGDTHGAFAAIAAGAGLTPMSNNISDRFVECETV